MECSGKLIFSNAYALSNPSDQETVDRYQNFKRTHESVSLIGEGHGCCACLMLAARFMPDEVLLFPLLGASIQELIKDVTSRVPFPYFICAPIKIYLGYNVSIKESKKLRRFLMRFSSFHKELVYLDNESVFYNKMSIQVNRIKTLA